MTLLNDRKIKIILGSLLHDIGKTLYSKGNNKNHCDSGYDFLKNEVNVQNDEILKAVKYHHYTPLSGSAVDDSSIAYITYIADNIASASDRCISASSEPEVAGNSPLESVFNLLNNNNGKKYYAPDVLNKAGINYPADERVNFDSEFYSLVKSQLIDTLKVVDFENPFEEYIDSLLETTENLLTYVPSSTSATETTDISLFDHLKLTSALSSCIYDYLEDKNICNYREALLENAESFYSQKAFLMYSIDISGIQSFIYTINTEGALKTLRARSFYLEIFMETIIDELLTRLELSRANIIYSGGGHCYILLANTQHTKTEIDNFEKEVNSWLLKNFRTKLYVAGGYSECCASDFRNEPDGSYAEIFSNMSRTISRKKLMRYSIDDITELNQYDNTDGLRECKVCKSLEKVNDDGYCSFCNNLQSMSLDIMDTDFFSIVRDKGRKALKLPFNCYLVTESESSLKQRMQNDGSYVRSYGKNKMFIDKKVATKLWVGAYHSEDETEKLAKAAEGIDRIAVLRADVDNLGHAFVHGFERDDVGKKYVTLSRTATLSRQLSLFFKKHINHILANGKYALNELNQERNAVIVYSGGDDVFVIGAWNDVIGFAIDLKNEFKKFTENTLSISAGIGIYNDSFPISMSAKEVEVLEDSSKGYTDSNGKNKNAVTVFSDENTYSWTDFENSVLNEKLDVLKGFFKDSKERGLNFLYNLLFYIRNCDDKINIARYAYLLSRMEPNNKDDKEAMQKYSQFSQKLYSWIQTDKDRKELVTAINIYAYLVRNTEGE